MEFFHLPDKLSVFGSCNDDKNVKKLIYPPFTSDGEIVFRNFIRDQTRPVNGVFFDRYCRSQWCKFYFELQPDLREAVVWFLFIGVIPVDKFGQPYIFSDKNTRAKLCIYAEGDEAKGRFYYKAFTNDGNGLRKEVQLVTFWPIPPVWEESWLTIIQKFSKQYYEVVNNFLSNKTEIVVSRLPSSTDQDLKKNSLSLKSSNNQEHKNRFEKNWQIVDDELEEIFQLVKNYDQSENRARENALLAEFYSVNADESEEGKILERMVGFQDRILEPLASKIDNWLQTDEQRQTSMRRDLDHLLTRNRIMRLHDGDLASEHEMNQLEAYQRTTLELQHRNSDLMKVHNQMLSELARVNARKTASEINGNRIKTLLNNAEHGLQRLRQLTQSLREHYSSIGEHLEEVKKIIPDKFYSKGFYTSEMEHKLTTVDSSKEKPVDILDENFYRAFIVNENQYKFLNARFSSAQNEGQKKALELLLAEECAHVNDKFHLAEPQFYCDSWQNYKRLFLLNKEDK